MIAQQRREKTLELIRRDGFASLASLTSEMNVSASTVRRDLVFWEQVGLVRRTHGGVFYTGGQPENPHFQQHQQSAQSQKQAIAQVAAEMISDGDTVLLDGGSTTYELGQQLVGRDLQIVTNSLPLANLFSRSETTDLILLGGYLHSRTGVVLGPYTEKMLQQLHCRWAFLSVAGADSQQLYNNNQLLVETERAMMSAVDTVVVLADSSKFGRKGMIPLCRWDRIDRVVVDADLSADWQCQLAGKVEVVLAPLTADSTAEP